MKVPRHPNHTNFRNSTNIFEYNGSTDINSTFTLFTTSKEEVRFIYLPEQKKVNAYLVGLEDKEVLRLIKSEDMPKELRVINDQEALKYLLENAYVKVTSLDNGDIKLYINQRGLGGGKKEDDALLSATRDGKVEEVKSLLDKGANIEAKDNNGRTSLHLASANGKVNIVSLLLSFGNNTVDAKDNNGDTALHRAAFNGQLKPLELLMNKGADLSLKNNKEQTVLDLAKSSNKQETIKYLESRAIERGEYNEQEKISTSKDKDPAAAPADIDHSKESTDLATDEPFKNKESTDKETKIESETSNTVQTTTSSPILTTSQPTSPQISTSSLPQISSATQLLPSAIPLSLNSASLNLPLLPLTLRLKALYKAQDTLPKLIEDASVPEQKMDDYYVKLQIVLKDKKNGEEKQPIVLSQMFEQVEQQEAVGKVLITGVAGIGKTSLLSHISYEWSKGKAFSDKFEYVLKVRLKSLLDEGLANELRSNYAKEDRLAAFIQRSIEQQQNEIRNSVGNDNSSISTSSADTNNNNNSLTTLSQDKTLAFSPFTLEEIKNIDKTKTVLLLDGYDEIEHLNRGKYHITRELISEIFKSYPNVVLTSRPNAVTSTMEGNLERKIEAIGLGPEGVLQYIDRYFGKQAQWLSEEVEQLVEQSKRESKPGLKIEDMYSMLGYYESRQNDIRAKEIYASFEAIDSYMDRQGIHDKNPTQINQSIDSYYRELKDSLLKVYYNNPTLRDTLVTPINLAMICLISTDNEVLQEFQGDFNAGKLYEEVVYWLGKRYLAKFKEMAPEDIVKERVFNLDELSILEQAAHDKFSINKVLIPGRDIDKLTHDKDKSHELNIRHINKYGLLKPETSKTLHNIEIRIHSQPTDEELTNPQNTNKLYLCYDKATNQLSYAAISRNGIERKTIIEQKRDNEGKDKDVSANVQTLHIPSPESISIPSNSLQSIKESIIKGKVKSIDKLATTQDKEAIINFFASQGYNINESQLHTTSSTNEAVEAHDLINRDHRFIHLSFQEYLTALSLTNQLASDNKAQVTQVAQFIAEHKNEPRYLMTLKFMAGIITNAKNEQQSLEEQQKAYLLVTRFWEAVTCNLDGALELGLETKVTLLMHLLEQAKTKEGKIDQRIPNLQAIKQLIDDTVFQDITRWGDQIVQSGYLSVSIADKLLSIMKQEQGGQQTVTEQEHKTSIEVITSLANKEEFGGKESILKFLTSVVISNNWQLQNLALGKIDKFIDKTSNKDLIKDIAEKAMQLTGNENSTKNACLLLTKIISADTSLGSTILEHLVQILKDHGYPGYYNYNNTLKEAAVFSLTEAVKVIPIEEALIFFTKLIPSEKVGNSSMYTAAYGFSIVGKARPESAEIVATSLIKVIADKNAGSDTTEVAIKGLSQVVKARPETAGKVLSDLIELIADNQTDIHVKKVVVKYLSEVVKARPETAEIVFPALTGLIAGKVAKNDNDPEIKKAAAKSLIEAVKARPETALEAFSALTGLIANKEADSWTMRIAAYNLSEIIKARPETAERVLSALVELIEDEKADSAAKRGAAESLMEVIKVRPETAEIAAIAFIKLIANKKTDSRTKISAAKGLNEAVKVRPETAEIAATSLMEMIEDKQADSNTKKAAAYSLSEVVKARPETALEAFSALTGLIANKEVDSNAKEAAAYSLSEVVKARPETALEAFFALTGLIANKAVDSDTKKAVAYSLSEVVKARPETALEAFSALTGLIANKEVDSHAKKAVAKSLGEVVKVRPEISEKVLFALTELIEDEKADSAAKICAINSLSEVIKARSDTAERVLSALTTVIADTDKESDVSAKFAAVYCLSEVVKARPETAERVLSALPALVANADKIMRSNIRKTVAESLIEAVKVRPEIAEMALTTFTWLMVDKRGEDDSKGAAAQALSEVVRARPETAERVLSALVELLANEKVSSSAKEAAAKSLSAMVKATPLNKVPDLLKHTIPAVREAAAREITEKLRSPEELTRIDHKQIFTLFEIIELCKVQESETFKTLDIATKYACRVISQNIISSEEGLDWLNYNFARFPNSPESLSCLKEFYSQMLSDGVITELEKEFILKCIIEKGLTSTIMPEESRIVFENVSYPIEVREAGEAENINMLHEIAQTVIESTRDSNPLAKQHFDHTPLFLSTAAQPCPLLPQT